MRVVDDDISLSDKRRYERPWYESTGPKNMSPFFTCLGVLDALFVISVTSTSLSPCFQYVYGGDDNRIPLFLYGCCVMLHLRRDWTASEYQP
jgi:hypothetical protein